MEAFLKKSDNKKTLEYSNVFLLLRIEIGICIRDSFSPALVEISVGEASVGNPGLKFDPFVSGKLVDGDKIISLFNELGDCFRSMRS